MSQIVSHLTQSRYYSPAFNAAVFDGPIRIYFAQHQESLALKVYFRLQNRMKDASNTRNTFRQSGQTVFLMLYPTVEAFETSFSKQIRENVVQEDLGGDVVLGVRGPLEDDDYEQVFRKVEEVFATYHHVETMGAAEL
jgi:hypothetical protein